MKSLKELSADRYRVKYEESYYAQYGPKARVADPDLQVMPCKFGHIYVHSDGCLAASVDTRGKIANKLKKLPGCQLLQDADDGVNVSFPIELFDRVVALMRPNKRRRLSEERRRQLVAAGAKGRAKMAARRARRGAGSEITGTAAAPGPRPARNPRGPERKSRPNKRDRRADRHPGHPATSARS